MISLRELLKIIKYCVHDVYYYYKAHKESLIFLILIELLFIIKQYFQGIFIGDIDLDNYIISFLWFFLSTYFIWNVCAYKSLNVSIFDIIVFKDEIYYLFYIYVRRILENILNCAIPISIYSFLINFNPLFSILLLLVGGLLAFPLVLAYKYILLIFYCLFRGEDYVQLSMLFSKIWNLLIPLYYSYINFGLIGYLFLLIPIVSYYEYARYLLSLGIFKIDYLIYGFFGTIIIVLGLRAIFKKVLTYARRTGLVLIE
jgi:hypothetical protein